MPLCLCLYVSAYGYVYAHAPMLYAPTPMAHAHAPMHRPMSMSLCLVLVWVPWSCNLLLFKAIRTKTPRLRYQDQPTNLYNTINNECWSPSVNCSATCRHRPPAMWLASACCRAVYRWRPILHCLLHTQGMTEHHSRCQETAGEYWHARA